MTETGTATGAETEATMTGIQTETGTDNSTEVGTGRTLGDSRNMRLRGIPRSDFEAQRGVYFKRDYRFDSSRKECDKCGSWEHLPWGCKKYNKYAPNEFTICNKGLHH